MHLRPPTPRPLVTLRRAIGAELIFVLAAAVIAGCAPSRGSGVAAEDAQTASPSLLETLTSPELGGRLTGSEGNAQAAALLARVLEAVGGEPLPGSDTLLEWYEQPVVSSAAPPVFAFQPIGEERCPIRLVPGEDFAVLTRPGLPTSAEIQAPLAVAQADAFSVKWIHEHRGEAALVPARLFDSAPAEAIGGLFAPEAGLAAVILRLPEEVARMQRSVYLPDGEYGGDGPLLVQVTHAVGQAMETVMPAEVAIRSSYAVEQRRVAGVAALVNKGSNPELPPLVIGAHFDGQGRTGPVLFPGAVDNASGVVGVVEVARRIADNAAAGRSPDRPVWIVLFNGEEQGLYGSREFVDRHRDQLRDAIVINLDMVAHDATRPFEIAAADQSQELAADLSALLEAAGLSTSITASGGSDHVSFEGVASAVSIVQAPYPRMHSATDTPDQVDGELLQRLVSVLSGAADKL